VVAIAFAVIVFGLALVGIGSGAASVDRGAQASRTVNVAMTSFAFKPPSLTVGKGSTVVFNNTSGTAHTATRNGSFTTGRVKAGRSASIRFNQRGTFRYHCTIHPFMKGKVVVD
jgi:plastocyanin